MKFLIVIWLTFSIISCKHDKKIEKKATTLQTETIMTFGLNYSVNENSVFETYNTITEMLQSNSNIGIVAQIDHAKNADKNGLELRDTKVVLFGNPRLGTPIMMQNQEAGLDLPQKILVFQNADGNTVVSYNNVKYVSLRHGLKPVETMPKIKNALQKITLTATNSKEIETMLNEKIGTQGIVRVNSKNDFETTYTLLKTAIENNPNLKLMATLDHQKNAAKVDYKLNPTRLLIFGNPNLGTPLMQNAQTVAIDLPQKMLVWEDQSGNVTISYNDPEYLKSRHAIKDQDAIISKISGALKKLSLAATQQE